MKGENNIIPTTLLLNLNKQINENSIATQYGRMISVKHNSFSIPTHHLENYKARWADETFKIDENVGDKWTSQVINLHNMYFNFHITNDFMEEEGIMQHIEDNVFHSIVAEENRVLLDGDGKNSPFGIFYYIEKDEIKSIVEDTPYRLVSLLYNSMEYSYIKDSIWIANQEFITELTLDLTSRVNPLSISGNKLYDLPLVTVHNTRKPFIMLINLKKSYLSCQRGHIESSIIDLNPFTKQVCFSKKIGGDVINSSAIKYGLLKVED